MGLEANGDDQALEQLRHYLCIVARKHIDRRLWAKVDPSDIVQKTLLDAHRKRDQLRDSEKLKAWLRAMLLNDIKDALRSVRPTVSLEGAVDESFRGIDSALAADQTSPSGRAVINEELYQLAKALAQLPERQRLAVELHHLHGWSSAEVADQLKCTKPAVAGLLQHGLQKLFQLLKDRK